MTQDANTDAVNDHRIFQAVADGSKAWKDAFNAGNAAGAAALYEIDAVMVAKPFGTFKGREEIQGFWAKLIADGFSDVIYKNTVVTVLDGSSAKVAADWTMNNAGGIITNEHWVVQEDGRALMRKDHFEAKG